MREQDIASGYPSLALPYGWDAADGKRPFEPPEIVSIPPLDPASDDPLAFVVRRLGIADAHLGAARRAAEANHSDSASELIVAGVVGDRSLAQATASALALPCRTIDHSPSRALGEPATAGSKRMLRPADAPRRAMIAPRLEDLGHVAELIAARPVLAAQLEVSTQADIAAVRAATTAAERLEHARLSLSRDRLDLSARIVVTGPQGFVAALVLVGLVQFFLGASQGGAILHLATLVLYLGCIALRFMAAASLWRARLGSNAAGTVLPAALVGGPVRRRPVYSVLVALRGETADTVDALVAALGALEWPKARLEIFMICEEDDRDTVATVRDAIQGKPWFRLVEAPPSQPRTKPKALNFALPLADGEFVVLYDAEDKPAPRQLESAWAAFRQGGRELACVQAPLVISNGRKGWLPAHFAIEYAALFFGLLPWLGRHRMPLPLGGTSNHFRREALLAVGGWDSHNVTEDADLGMRLARCGYRTGTIDAPTLEEAPERWIDWHKQRTRWMKGYAQTWLVHMRRPVELMREIGVRNFAVFQLLFAGMILSSVLNTIVLGALAYNVLRVLANGWPPGFEGVLLYLDTAILVVGFAVYAALAAGACRRGRCAVALSELWTVPAYWLLVSFATCRALCHLATKPHHWEKTPHGAAARRRPEALRREASRNGEPLRDDRLPTA